METLLRAASLLLQTRDEEILRLRWWNDSLTDANYNLGLALSQAQTPEEGPEIKMEKQPLYLSEEQEDIQWQYDNELIDLKTYEALLKELEFENSEIQFDEDYAVENFHY